MSRYHKIDKYIGFITCIIIVSTIGSYRWPMWYSNLFLLIFPFFIIYHTIKARRSWKKFTITLTVMSLIYGMAICQRLTYEQ